MDQGASDLSARPDRILRSHCFSARLAYANQYVLTEASLSVQSLNGAFTRFLQHTNRESHCCDSSAASYTFWSSFESGLHLEIGLTLIRLAVRGSPGVIVRARQGLFRCA